jgi:hypothetical protein
VGEFPVGHSHGGGDVVDDMVAVEEVVVSEGRNCLMKLSTLKNTCKNGQTDTHHGGVGGAGRDVVDDDLHLGLFLVVDEPSVHASRDIACAIPS